ncbi:MAG: hypothetical protein P4L55_12205 [Syntrophobacteraceae bacterium]|nr:hypothetical protein [Syntrophobacteraceae bacterium]
MTYTRLPGKRKGFFRKWTLWLGDNHLLAVESNYFTESYKHFDLKGIQAITFCPTSGYKVRNIVYAAALAVFGFLLLVLPGHSIFLVLITCAGLAFSILSLINNLRKGPTCSCRLKMDLATHELPSLCRFRYGRKTLAIIRPLVLEHQRDLLSGRQETTAGVMDSAMFAAVGGAAPDLRPTWQEQPAHCGGQVHIVAFSLLLLAAALRLGQLYPRVSSLFLIPDLIVNCALVMALLTALARQHGRTLAPTAGALPWCALIFCLASYMFDYVFCFMQFFLRGFRPKPGMTWIDLYHAVAASGAFSHPLLLKAHICFIAVTGALGFWGLGAVMSGRRLDREPQSRVPRQPETL